MRNNKINTQHLPKIDPQIVDQMLQKKYFSNNAKRIIAELIETASGKPLAKPILFTLFKKAVCLNYLICPAAFDAAVVELSTAKWLRINRDDDVIIITGTLIDNINEMLSQAEHA